MADLHQICSCLHVPARVIPFAVSNIYVTTEPIKEQSQTQEKIKPNADFNERRQNMHKCSG